VGRPLPATLDATSTSTFAFCEDYQKWAETHNLPFYLQEEFDSVFFDLGLGGLHFDRFAGGLDVDRGGVYIRGFVLRPIPNPKEDER
jgi:hypothetical protein